MSQDPLEPLGEDWQHGLAIVAHPDDLEFGAAAAIARWTGQGKQIVYCLVTSGEAGIDAMAPAQARLVREAEQRVAAAVVGVTVVEFLGQPDGIVEYGVPLRRALARVIRRHQPEIVITNNFRDTWDGAVVLNQADHRATGRAVLDAVQRCGQPVGVPRVTHRGPGALGRCYPGVGRGVAGRPSRGRHHRHVRAGGGVPPGTRGVPARAGVRHLDPEAYLAGARPGCGCPAGDPLRRGLVPLRRLHTLIRRATSEPRTAEVGRVRCTARWARVAPCLWAPGRQASGIVGGYETCRGDAGAP